MIKKILKGAVVIALTMGLAACSSNTFVSDNVKSKIQDIVKEEVEKNKDVVEDTTEEIVEDQSPIQEEESEDDWVVIVDENDVKITAKSLKQGDFAKEMEILIENNSDKNLCFQVESADFNGYVIDGILSENIPSHKKSNTTIYFDNDEFERNNIETIKQITISFRIFDQDDWSDMWKSNPYMLVVVE